MLTHFGLGVITSPRRGAQCPCRTRCRPARALLGHNQRRVGKLAREHLAHCHDRVVARGESYRLVGPQRLAHTQDERRPSSPFSTAGAATAAAAAATAFLEGTVRGSSCCSCWCCPSSAGSRRPTIRPRRCPSQSKKSSAPLRSPGSVPSRRPRRRRTRSSSHTRGETGTCVVVHRRLQDLPCSLPRTGTSRSRVVKHC